MVIAAYKPKDGKDPELRRLLKNHLPILSGEGLVTDRKSTLMRAKDGTYLEIFEWKSQEAVDRAHTNKAVLALWEEFHAVCEYVALNGLEESKDMFAHFEPIDL